MKWCDLRKKFEEASDAEKIRMLESGEASDINILRYFVSPDNYDSLTKEEIWDALSVLTAYFCDERKKLINLEDSIAQKLGEEACYEICAMAVPDIPCERLEQILDIENSEEKAKTALEFLDQVGE